MTRAAITRRETRWIVSALAGEGIHITAIRCGQIIYLREAAVLSTLQRVQATAPFVYRSTYRIAWRDHAPVA